MMRAATCVPTVNHRKRIPNAAIEDVVAQIVEKFQPQRIILFGSYANGKPRPDSDVDILVVMESPRQDVEQAVEICQQIDYLFGLDLMVISPHRLDQRLSWGDSFLSEILETGKTLYETPDA